MGAPEVTLPTVVPALADAAPDGFAPTQIDPPRQAVPTRATALHPRDPHRYQIIAEHGRGGLGRVTRVYDRELGRDIAIKELLARDPQREVRFLREALLTAHLEHPGIVPVHEAGRWPDGTPFYAMKLVSGRPLRALLRERTAIEDRLAILHHVIAVADAIAYAHDRKIIHRDLKPENIIVGDFGETVVIDWGLAKDLGAPSADDELPMYATGSGDGLTQVGAVLGTPAYMAPEQLRGEPVDQRADVFAIGVMLWELCTSERLSLVEPAHRRAQLRRAHIDDDLIAIITKALHADRAARYADASELAADLKAFKSGARIRARRYSPLAVLAHWVRHHRALTIAMLGAAALAVTGGIVYVHDITLERDRADRAHADLTLKHAQLLMTSDPTAALDTLATYQGSDRALVDQLQAEARARGIAVVRAKPGDENVLWAAGLADGSIASLDLNGVISKTSTRGSAVLADNMTGGAGRAYAAKRHLLAYACQATALCLLDVERGVPIETAQAFRGMPIKDLAFSPNEARIALLLRDDQVRIFDIPDLAHPSPRRQITTPAADQVRFLGDDTVVVATQHGGELVDLDGRVRRFELPASSLRDVDPSARDLVFATDDGIGWLVEAGAPQAAVHQQLCPGKLTELEFLIHPHRVAYSCRDGNVGIWDVERASATPRVHLEGGADSLAVNAAGDVVIAAGGSGVLALIDLSTGLINYYRGQGFRNVTLVAPTAEYPYILSGDVQGGLRAWPLPPRYARMIAETSDRFVSAINDPHSGAAIASDSRQPTLTVASSTGAPALRRIGPHVPDAYYLQLAASGGWFAAYGYTDQVELWSTRTLTRTAVFDTHHGSVSHLEFEDDADALFTAGEDGNLRRWTFTGESTPIAHFAKPVVVFAVAPTTHVTLVGTADGQLWQIARDGHVALLPHGPAKAIHMQRLPDGVCVCIGFVDGEVELIDTRSGQRQQLLRAGGSIRDIAVTPDNRMIAVAGNDGTLHIGTRPRDTWFGSDTTWTTLPARARKIALTADGLLIAVCTDGIVWLWSSVQRAWLGLATNATPATVVVDHEGDTATTLNNQGQIMAIDLQAAREILRHSPRK